MTSFCPLQGRHGPLCLEQLTHLGKKLADMCWPGTMVALSGPLGVGKTTLVRSMMQVLCPQVSLVPSPTFPLMIPYESLHGTLWHVDLYRLETLTPQDVTALGLEDLASQDICLVEWPHRLPGPLPAKRHIGCTLTFAPHGQQRWVHIESEERL